MPSADWWNLPAAGGKGVAGSRAAPARPVWGSRASAGTRHYRHTENAAKSLILPLPRPITPRFPSQTFWKNPQREDRMAGHSQFKNIMHRKGRQDAQKSKLFSKLAREITVAAKMGQPDPSMNARLRAAIISARQENMSKDSIPRALKKASGSGSENYDEIGYEGYGPGGVAVIVEALTWKTHNTVPVDDETGEKLLKLIDLLNEHDDVQNVYANFEVSDALMAKMGG